MTIGKILQNKMPIDFVIAECGECGIELYHSSKAPPNTPYITGSIIEMKALSHKEKTDHDDLQIEIDKTTPVKEIDCTVTVND